MNFAEQLKEIRKSKKMTQEQLARLCNVSQGTVANWEKGKRTPDIETMSMIADVLNVSLDVLSGKLTPTPPIPNAAPMPSACIRMVPLFESVSAGFGAAARGRVIDFLPIYIESDAEAAETICVRVCGDSMYPKIEDGDIVQVHKQPTADTGDIVVIRDGDEAFVKRFIRGKNGIVLESLNPAYPPMKFSRDESNRLAIEGIVRAIIRRI